MPASRRMACSRMPRVSYVWPALVLIFEAGPVSTGAVTGNACDHAPHTVPSLARTQSVSVPRFGTLRALAAERRRFGYRRLREMARRKGNVMNLKKVYRLYREEG